MADGVTQYQPGSPEYMAAIMQTIGGPQQQQMMPAQGQLQEPPQPQPQGAPQQGAIPPTTPFDLAHIVSQVSALPEYQQPTQRLEQIGGQEQDIQKRMQNLPMPKMGFTPTFEHGAGVGGFFHNLGQSLLALAAATGPGRAVQNVVYGPGMRQYGAQRKSLAEQLSALKDQEAIPTEELRATTGLASAAGLAGYRGQMAQTAARRVDAYAQSIQDRAKNFAAMQDWRAAGLDEKKRHAIVQEAQQAADEAGRNFREQNRDATTEEVAHIVTGTREQIANEAAARDPSVKSWFFNALGISVPQVQGAPSPEFRPTQKAGAPPAVPAKPAKPKAGSQQFHYDKQGNRVAGP